MLCSVDPSTYGLHAVGWMSVYTTFPTPGCNCVMHLPASTQVRFRNPANEHLRVQVGEQDLLTLGEYTALYNGFAMGGNNVDNEFSLVIVGMVPPHALEKCVSEMNAEYVLEASEDGQLVALDDSYARRGLFFRVRVGLYIYRVPLVVVYTDADCLAQTAIDNPDVKRLEPQTRALLMLQNNAERTRFRTHTGQLTMYAARNSLDLCLDVGEPNAVYCAAAMLLECALQLHSFLQVRIDYTSVYANANESVTKCLTYALASLNRKFVAERVDAQCRAQFSAVVTQHLMNAALKLQNANVRVLRDLACPATSYSLFDGYAQTPPFASAEETAEREAAAMQFLADHNLSVQQRKQIDLGKKRSGAHLSPRSSPPTRPRVYAGPVSVNPADDIHNALVFSFVSPFSE